MKLIKTLGLGVSAAVVATFAVAMESSKSTPADATGVTGTASGTIVFDGELPKVKPLTISAEQAKGCCAAGDSVDDSNLELVVDKDSKGIQNVVVTLSVPGEELKVPEEAVLVDQQGCRFTPHVVIVAAGTTISYGNSDSLSHNIHTYAAKNEGINQTVAAGQNYEQKLEKAESVKVTCDIHPWMVSHIYVTEDTHWALTGADGSFKIEGLPAGEYDLTLWHEKLGKGKGKVTIAEDGSSEAVEIKLGAKKKKKRGGR